MASVTFREPWRPRQLAGGVILSNSPLQNRVDRGVIIPSISPAVADTILNVDPGAVICLVA